VIGVHVNAATVGFIPLGAVDDDVAGTLTAREQARLARLGAFLADGNGYFQIQATRPNTPGIRPERLTGRPAGLDRREIQGVDLPRQRPARALRRPGPAADQRDAVLAHRHRGLLRSALLRGHALQPLADPSSVPTGVAAFAEDVAIRRFAEQLNNVVHWSDFDEGGHFAAMERAGLLAADLRAFAQARPGPGS